MDNDYTVYRLTDSIHFRTTNTPTIAGGKTMSNNTYVIQIKSTTTDKSESRAVVGYKEVLTEIRDKLKNRRQEWIGINDEVILFKETNTLEEVFKLNWTRSEPLGIMDPCRAQFILTMRGSDNKILVSGGCIVSYLDDLIRIEKESAGLTKYRIDYSMYRGASIEQEFVLKKDMFDRITELMNLHPDVIMTIHKSMSLGTMKEVCRLDWSRGQSVPGTFNMNYMLSLTSGHRVKETRNGVDISEPLMTLSGDSAIEHLKSIISELSD